MTQLKEILTRFCSSMGFGENDENYINNVIFEIEFGDQEYYDLKGIMSKRPGCKIGVMPKPDNNFTHLKLSQDICNNLDSISNELGITIEELIQIRVIDEPKLRNIVDIADENVFNDG